MDTNKFNISKYILFLLLLLTDAFALLIALEVATSLFHLEESSSNYYWITVLSLFTLLLEKVYFTRHDFWGDLKRIYKALFFSFLAVFTVITLTKISVDYSHSFIFVFFLLAFFTLPFFKRVSKKIIFTFNFFKLKVHVVAKGKQKTEIEEELEENWYFGFQPTSNNYDMVIINSKSFPTPELETLIQHYTNRTKDIYVIPYMSHLDFSHATIIDYSNIRLSAIHIENRLLNYKNILIKYIFEKTLTLLIFPFALFLHIFISLAIKLDSKGSAIFKQKRLGKDAKPFSCYKYRTMYENGDEILQEYLESHPDEKEYYEEYHKYKNDPRITKIGNFLRKSSLDEFPQFYNILQGKMNLIGPRPYMLNEREKIGKVHEEIILKVKPGITGLWQVNGRNKLSFQERVQLDSWYIQNWSLWGDFVILLKTVKVVLFKVGAK